MAAWKLLAPGISLGTASTILLAFAMASERWYVLDATLYGRFCPQQEFFAGLSPWQVHAYGGVKALRGNEALKPAPLKIGGRSGALGGGGGLKRSGRDLSGSIDESRTSRHFQEDLSGALGGGGGLKRSRRDLSGSLDESRTSRHFQQDLSGALGGERTSGQFGADLRGVLGRGGGAYKRSGKDFSAYLGGERTSRRSGANLRGASKRDGSSTRSGANLSGSLGGEQPRKDFTDLRGGIGSSRRSGAGLTPVGYREEFVDLPEAEKILRWRELMRDLATNLRSFGGRDITAQRRSLKVGGENKAKSNGSTSNAGVQMTSCQRRQFTTATGLWKTCYLPEAGSLLAKLIDCGNLTRCMPVLYGVVDISAVPRSLFPNETAKMYRDEATLLNVRRTVASFLFLALVTQFSGVLVTSWGWFCNDGFEQYAGGLVMLMSGIFQLSCLCTHIIQCRIEMTRSPEDLYSLPNLVLHSYGAAVRAAWSAFVLSVLASFLCVMAPLHPAQHSDAPPCVKQVSSPESPPAIARQTPSTPAMHHSPMHQHPSNLVRVTPMRSVNQVSPGAEGKPPTVAIEPWDANSRFEQLVPKISKAGITQDGIDQEKGEEDWRIQRDTLLRKQKSVELCRSAISEAQKNRANYYARTRSLPRQIAFTGEARTNADNRRSSTIARCGKAEWLDRVVASPHRMPRLTQEVGDQQKVMEIFRSAGIRQADHEDSDQEDVPALRRTVINGRESVKTNFRLPCEQSASKFGTHIS